MHNVNKYKKGHKRGMKSRKKKKKKNNHEPKKVHKGGHKDINTKICKCKAAQWLK